MDYILIALAVSVSYTIFYYSIKRDNPSNSEYEYYKFLYKYPHIKSESQRMFEEMQAERAYRESIFNLEKWRCKPSPLQDAIFNYIEELGKENIKQTKNVWCYTKEAIISTKVDAEYKCLFNHKCFCGTLNRLFCIARVI